MVVLSMKRITSDLLRIRTFAKSIFMFSFFLCFCSDTEEKNK